MITFIEDFDYYNFMAKKQFSDQEMEVEFQGHFCEEEERFYWNIAICVYDDPSQKEANYRNMRNTGRNGIATLLFAKEVVKDFESYIVDHMAWAKHTLYAGWMDERRHVTYKRGLEPIGFIETNMAIPGDDGEYAQEFHLVKCL